jgi:hypothetical protein
MRAVPLGRGLVRTLCCAACLACATDSLVPDLPEPGPHVLLLPVEDLPGQDPVATAEHAAARSVQAPDAVKRSVEAELRGCLRTDDREVVGPKAFRQIRARMRQEIAAARGGVDPEALPAAVEATVARYALREFLDDHPEVTAVVRSEWRKVEAAESLFGASWDGVSYDIQGRPAYGLGVLLGQNPTIGALSLRVSIETRAGAPQSVSQGGIGLLVRHESGSRIPLQYGEVDTSSDLIHRGVRVALRSLCGNGAISMEEP